MVGLGSGNISSLVGDRMKLKILRALFVLCFVAALLLAVALAPAHGQSIDSQVSVKSFIGNTVAQKLTAAMVSCTWTPSVKCYLVLDPSLAAFPDGGVSGVSLCSGCILLDYRNGFPASSSSAASGACPANEYEIADTAMGPSCAQVNYSQLGGSPPATGIQTINSQTGPAITIAGDPYITVTVGASNTINVAHTNLDQTNSANTHTTGTQLVETGTTTTVGRQIQASGFVVANIIQHNTSAAALNGGSAVSAAVSAGEVQLAQTCRNDTTAPTSSLGNTYSTLQSNSCINGQNGELFISNPTVGGTDTINIPPIGDSSPGGSFFLNISGIPTSSPLDGANSVVASTGTGTVTPSVTTTNANDLLILFSDAENSPCAPVNPAGWTQLDLVNSGTGEALLSYRRVSSTGTYSAAVTFSGGSCSGTNVGATIYALKISATFVQAADFDEWLDSSGIVRARIGPNFDFEPPQSAGTPVFVPDQPGAIVYDTTNHAEKFYSDTLSWQTFATLAGAQSLLAPTRGTGTNGSYTVTPTLISSVLTNYYDEDVNTGTLNNATTTTVTIPHSLATAVDSCVCADNSSRVQSGNTQPIGCNISGQSAPFATIQVWVGATGESAFCRVRGY